MECNNQINAVRNKCTTQFEKLHTHKHWICINCAFELFLSQRHFQSLCCFVVIPKQKKKTIHFDVFCSFHFLICVGKWHSFTPAHAFLTKNDAMHSDTVDDYNIEFHKYMISAARAQTKEKKRVYSHFRNVYPFRQSVSTKSMSLRFALGQLGITCTTITKNISKHCSKQRRPTQRNKLQEMRSYFFVRN